MHPSTGDGQKSGLYPLVWMTMSWDIYGQANPSDETPEERDCSTVYNITGKSFCPVSSSPPAPLRFWAPFSPSDHSGIAEQTPGSLLCQHAFAVIKGSSVTCLELIFSFLRASTPIRPLCLYSLNQGTTYV